MTGGSEASDKWREDGFVVLPSFLPAAELQDAVTGLSDLYPSAEGFHSGDNDQQSFERFADEFGGIEDFPFASPELGLLAVHPRLVELAAALLDTEDLRVYSIEAWAKFTGAAVYDQEHHRDYLGQSLLVPSSDPRFSQVEMFIYLCDVPADLGPTAYVPASAAQKLALPLIPNWYPRPGHARHDPDHPDWVADRAAPGLYENEVLAEGPIGTVVAYRNDTFHRGTELTRPDGARYTLHSNFRPAASEWQSRHSWLRRANTGRWAQFASRATSRQLQLFGVPEPGHPYWTRQTLRGMAERYPALDLTPWEQSLVE